MRSGPTSSMPGTPLADRSLPQRVESRQLGLVEGDHELAAAFERDAVRLGERFELLLALAAERRLERPGRVVQAGVEDAAVVPALVAGEFRLLLDDRQPQVGALLEEAVRGRQPEDPAADDDQVEAVVAHGARPLGATTAAARRAAHRARRGWRGGADRG